MSFLPPRDPVPVRPPGSKPPLLRVAAGSRPAAVAGAIAGSVRTHGGCEVQAIGAGAVNQAVKAVAIARSFVAAEGLDLSLVPAFHDLEVQGEERTAIRLLVATRPLLVPVLPVLPEVPS